MRITERHSDFTDAVALDRDRRVVDAERSLAVFLESVRAAQGECAHDEIGAEPTASWRLRATVYWPSFAPTTRR